MENKNNNSGESELRVVVVIFLLKGRSILLGRCRYAESFEECAAREPKKCHYVTIFMRVMVDVDVVKEQVPQNLEPTKCDGWDWYEWDHLSHPLFGPLEKMVKGAFDPFPI
uniref:Nudix hydrolase domain-containing protein n=1 Tax=Glycine max TaxID=3847 RepID=A0A0R0E3L4_SOYBN